MSSRPSENFTRTEMVASRDHPELALAFEEVEAGHLLNAMRVVLLYMQPARNLAGPIGVLSFIRGTDLNDVLVDLGAAVPDSDHLVGLACDFKPLRMSSEEFWRLAISGALQAAGCTWDKLNLYTGAGTFHVALRPVQDGPQRMRLYVDWQRVT